MRGLLFLTHHPGPLPLTPVQAGYSLRLQLPADDKDIDDKLDVLEVSLDRALASSCADKVGISPCRSMG